MAITGETIIQQLLARQALQTITDRQTRDLVAAWARTWDEIAGDLRDALLELIASATSGRLSTRALTRSSRLTKALRSATDELTRLAHDAGVQITGDLEQVIRLAGQAQHDLIATQLPPGGQDLAVTFDRADTRSLSAIVQRTTEQVTSLTRPLTMDATRAMKRELTRGVALGSNPRATAERILTRTEGAFNGGLTRALTISRTETLDAYRAGARLGRLLNTDVLAGWVWTADLSSRTCPACFSMDGSIHDVDEPGPDGHQNCRCTATPITRSWQDLGFDIPEPESVRPAASDVFDSLAPSDQLHILGPGRFSAWQAGEFPMSDWAVRQSNTGWRDSIVPARIPA